MRLVYTSDQMPGYKRIRHGKYFSYLLPDGRMLKDKAERKRILSLAIPPAYEEVWICPLENGHLQATGLDARRRKQYRYHAAWHEEAADRKFEMLKDFATALPCIRAALRRDLTLPGLSRERVIAGIVALLDLTGYRIGNHRYVTENRSFGLSSLLMRHLQQDSDRIQLKFRGKSGQPHQTEIASRKLTQLVTELQELPGQHLFRYEDEAGVCHDIDTADVNDWLKQAGDGDYTAKQFRTWRATVLCARELAMAPPSTARPQQDRALRAAIHTTAKLLNHTAATCRKYYIHPALITAYRSGALHQVMISPPPRLRKRDGTALLRADERRVFKLLTAN